MTNSVILSVGDTYHLRSGRDRIVYAGMPSEDLFSIVQRKREALPYGWSGQAWNLFFPRNQSTIRIDGIHIMVENVTKEEIRLRVG